MIASVLIVESNEMVRSLTAEILEDSGFAATEAATLAFALEQVAADPDEFDVLLVEAGMPDGCNFIASLRAVGYVRPIIAVNNTCRDPSRPADYGASAWLQKPFSINNLLQKVGTAVTQHRDHVCGAINASAVTLLWSADSSAPHASH